MLEQEIKNAILEGAFAMTRDGRKVRYIGKSSLPALELTFLVLLNDGINYYSPHKDIDFIFVEPNHFKAIPSTMEDHKDDIVGLWVEPTKKVTLELPQPFKPKLQETYYTLIGKAKYSTLEVGKTCHTNGTLDKALIEAGLCFRTEADAQAWIDAFKTALED